MKSSATANPEGTSVKFVLGAKAVYIPAAAAFAALVTVAIPAAAEPSPPPIPAPVPAPALSAPPLPPTGDVPAQAVIDSAAQPVVEGVPHLPSPENLPPGTTTTPTSSQPRLTYLRDLWHAMRTQEVSGGNALLLLTQRPMVADASPPRGLPTGPQAPQPAPAPDTPMPAAAPPLVP
ncbi:MAG: hypothetical protein AB7G47_03800 [Mycolicibacterium sp.]|uniref:hypothetical protein n=1 Tax=Mycolicibacterium sp. TaxID=2320850 RepID=UPI003D0FE438